MATELLINKSGVILPAFKNPDMTNQIGKIYNREAYAYIGGEGDWARILFLNANGDLQDGYVSLIPNKCCENCTNYPYGTVSINGIKYVTFKMRRTENVYEKSGNAWGRVANGRRVACQAKNWMNGDTHYDWKLIEYVERTDGAWIQVTSTGGAKYGYVDTGLSKGSNPNTISMYGTW